MNSTVNIYHGSEKIIEKPVFGEGKKHNDSRYTLDEFCEKYGTMWIIGRMNENAEEILSTQFASMQDRTIMPPEKRNYDIQLIKIK